MREWLVLAIASLCSAYNGCLHQQSLCKRDPECHKYLDGIYSTCGYSLTNCTAESPSDCVHLLWRIRDYFPYNSCVCYEALGFPEDCRNFHELIWNHPCENIMKDAGEQRRAIEQTFSLIPTSAIVNGSHKRTTRTPLSDQIRQLKTQLSGDLGTREVLGRATCDSALNDVCLRHISCRQLWSLFRASCGVDQDNRCTMADRETCWQSFEGLSWTGLGNCHCDSSNSDCHWIRLHTNYNKCIHEISRSGQFSSAGISRGHHSQSQAVAPTRAAPAQPATMKPVPTTTTSTTTTTTTTTTRRPPRTDSRYSVTTYTPRTTPRTMTTLRDQGRHQHHPGHIRTSTAAPSWRLTTTSGSVSHSNQQRHVAQQTQAEVHYRPLFEPQIRTTPNYYYHYTTATPRWDSRTYPTTPSQRTQYSYNTLASGRHEPVADGRYSMSDQRWNAQQQSPHVSHQQYYASPTQSSLTSFTQMEYSVRSSCQDTVARCEAAEECRWHLGELRVRCAPNSCRRSDCAAALQRFARFVPFALVESMMFCHCSAGDSLCAQQQEILYPKCLYSTSSTAITCTEAARKCDTDHRCRHLRHSLTANCPVAYEACAKTSLDECRRTILHARASILEQPCYCPLSDVECMAHQRTMIPNNPCIEKAMLDYSRLMGYNTPPAAKTVSIETNRVHEADYGNQSLVGDSQEESDRRLNQAGTPVGHRGTIRPGTSGEYPDTRRTDYGVARQSWSRQGSAEQKEGYRAGNWKEKDARKGDWSGGAGDGAEVHRLKTGWQDDSESESDRRVSSKGKESWSAKSRPGNAKWSTTPIPVWSSTHRKTTELAEGRRKEKPRTTLSPLPTEPPPPWETTTTQPPTTTFVTHAPPPPEGCNAKDASGRQIFVHTGSLIRKYVDWSGRCSSWCECVSEDELVCERLPCLEDGKCDAPLTSVDFGERLFLRDRGACFCESGTFICDLPEEMPEVYPGLYLSAGYSLTDVEMLRSEIPRDALERAGFLSSNAATDIASRLQIAFERVLPKGLQCRIVLMPEMSEPGSAFMRVEWFGKNEALNHTKLQWHTGWAEKACSPYVTMLASYFSLNDSPRFQLVLSTVKQLKVLDYLDGLPSSTSDVTYFIVLIVLLINILLGQLA
uniref:GDNF GAS1 domain containing protein n=1 Tax=Haemonchus contortus TaxID=6289 RepID=A0A7I4YI57_HAECO